MRFGYDDETESNGLLWMRIETERAWITGAKMEVLQSSSSINGQGVTADKRRRPDVAAHRNVRASAGCSTGKGAGRCLATTCAGAETRTARTKPATAAPSQSDGCGNFLLIRVNAGRVAPTRMSGAGEPSAKRQGDTCGETKLHAAEGSAFTSICLPRRDLLCVGPTANDKLEIKLDRNPAIRQGITGYLTLLSDVGATLDSTGQQRLQQHTLDMVGLLLSDGALHRALVPSVDPMVARMRLIERDITANLTDPQLSIGTVAARLGIHPKQVQRLFAASGRTFADFVLDERLQLARRKIAETYGTAEKISTIAFDVGFGDLAYFNRAFRNRFGQTPSEYRNLSIAA